MYIIDTNKDSNLIIELTQNDNNTGNIEFQILKDGKPLNITSKKVKLALVKNTTNKGDIITNVNITNPTSGIVSVPITTLITGKKGLFVCGLAVYNGDYLENTGNFRLNVKRDIFENTAEVIIKGSVYSELLKMLETSNKTITEYQQKINNSIDNFNSTKVETLKNFKNEKDKVITEFKTEGKTEADNREKEWDSLKKIAIKENNAVELQSQINVLDKALKSNQSLEYKSENITCNDTLNARTENLQILGNTKYKRKDESLTDVWEGGVSLESTGEVEKNLIKIKSCGKNLFNVEDFLSFNGGNRFKKYKNGFEIKNTAFSGTYKNVKTKNKFKKNTQYTISYKIDSKVGNSRLAVFYTDGSYEHIYSEYTTRKQKTISYITFDYGNSDEQGITKFYDIQVEEGITKTEFELYKNDTKQIQLSHPLRKVGDVADRIYEKDSKVWLEQNIRELKLNGNETWKKWNDEGDLIHFVHFFDKTAKDYIGICDNFLCTRESTGERINLGGWPITDINIRIHKNKLASEDTKSLKKWLSENPTTVLYQLTTPTTTELNIKNIDLDTFNPITHITSDNNVESTLDFEVPSNLASIVQANSRAINEIYDLIDTLITPQLIQNRLDIDINKLKK